MRWCHRKQQVTRRAELYKKYSVMGHYQYWNNSLSILFCCVEDIHHSPNGRKQVMLRNNVKEMRIFQRVIKQHV